LSLAGTIVWLSSILIWSSLHDLSFYHVIGLGEETWPWSAREPTSPVPPWLARSTSAPDQRFWRVMNCDRLSASTA
jgi:hypothetical protein